MKSRRLADSTPPEIGELLYGFLGEFGDFRRVFYADEANAQFFHVRGEQGEGGQRGGAYSESLAGRGGGVAERVEHVGAPFKICTMSEIDLTFLFSRARISFLSITSFIEC